MRAGWEALAHARGSVGQFVIEHWAVRPYLRSMSDKLINLSSASAGNATQALAPTDCFVRRHIGPDAKETAQMLGELGYSDLDSFIAKVVPPQTRLQRALDIPGGWSEHAVLHELRAIASKNQVFRNYIGMGYSDCITPPVILRNILENPGWYTQYTPYQAEIAQGRLEALLNFQTMVADLTGLDIANASLLDEATAAAEAMHVCQNVKPERDVFFVSENCHPQTIDVVKTRAKAANVEVVIGNHETFQVTDKVFGVLVQYPATYGSILDCGKFFATAHEAGAMTVVGADLLALPILRARGEFGADLAVGSAHRFGVPLGWGGPHAAY